MEKNTVKHGTVWEVKEVEPAISVWWMVLVAALFLALAFIILSFVVTGQKDPKRTDKAYLV